MLMKTELCSGMKFFCIIMSDVAFHIGKQDSWNIDITLIVKQIPRIYF